MTPTGAEILRGGFLALTEPVTPEAQGDFALSKVGVVGMLCFLMAQELDKGVAGRVAENQSIRSLFKDAAEADWSPPLSRRLLELSKGRDDDLTLTALDRANAVLRDALIGLHAAVEEAGGAAGQARELRIVRLMKQSAVSHRLYLPGLPAL
jgi:hypothetical protein